MQHSRRFAPFEEPSIAWLQGRDVHQSARFESGVAARLSYVLVRLRTGDRRVPHKSPVRITTSFASVVVVCRCSTTAVRVLVRD